MKNVSERLRRLTIKRKYTKSPQSLYTFRESQEGFNQDDK